jgi:hypothetical protein
MGFTGGWLDIKFIGLVSMQLNIQMTFLSGKPNKGWLKLVK